MITRAFKQRLNGLLEMLASLRVAAIGDRADRVVLFRLASFRFPFGQVGRDIAMLDALEPVDDPFVPVLPELQVVPCIAKVYQVPDGDVLHEDQQQLVAFDPGSGEDARCVETGQVPASFGNSGIDGCFGDGVIPARDGFYLFVMQVGV